MDKNEKIKKVFALLFAEASVSKKKLKELSLDLQAEEMNDLKERLKAIGAGLLESDKALELSLDSESSTWLTSLYSQDEKEELSDSASQILTLILYCGPISKFEIDYVRGVNSASSLHKLQLKGYIEKERHGKKNLYKASHKLLADFGLLGQKEAKERGSEFCKKIKKLLSLSEEHEK